jgi:hypothetical protein
MKFSSIFQLHEVHGANELIVLQKITAWPNHVFFLFLNELPRKYLVLVQKITLFLPVLNRYYMHTDFTIAEWHV